MNRTFFLPEIIIIVFWNTIIWNYDEKYQFFITVYRTVAKGYHVFIDHEDIVITVFILTAWPVKQALVLAKSAKKGVPHNHYMNKGPPIILRTFANMKIINFQLINFSSGDLKAIAPCYFMLDKFIFKTELGIIYEIEHSVNCFCVECPSIHIWL